MTLIIAHRGAARLEPENTIAAFERAGALGADGVELDVRRTVDDALVVHHDPRLADGRAICEVELHALPGHVPSVSDALDACTSMFVNLEIKNIVGEPDHDPDDRVALQLASLLGERGGGRRWLISSFRLATVDRIRESLPTARTAWLTLALNQEDVERAATAGHDAIHPNADTIAEAGIRHAHAAGLAVNVWTCNDADRMRQLMAWGVDGICTDVPDVALAVRSDRLG